MLRDSEKNGLTLTKLQSEFKQYLMLETGHISDHIDSSEELSNDFRLAIYANAYRMRLIEALEKDYPAVFYLLGEDAFAKTALAYISAYPSKHPSLRWFGQHFAKFFLHEAEFESMPYISELAKLEWLLVEAFDAKDVSTIQESDVANVPAEAWPSLVLHFHPSVHIFQYHWNIIPIWQAEKNESIPPQPVMLDSGEVCLVWRHKLETRYRTLEADEALVAGQMLQGEDFSVMCESLSTVVTAEEVAMKAAGLLKSWVNDGLIRDLSWSD